MTWTRLSDNFTDQLGLLSVSRSARLLHIEALVWCNRLETDGRLPAAAIRRLTDATEIAELVGELVEAGLWTGDSDSGTWLLDWSDQEPAEEVQARRQYRAEKQKRYRDRKSKHDRGDHSTCDPRFCSKAVTGNATGNATSNKTGDVTPSRPVPSRPEGEGQGTGRETGSAGATPARAAGKRSAWAIWGENEMAHRFTPNGDGTHCGFQWPMDGGASYECGEEKNDLPHAHEYDPESASDPACNFCEFGQAHPVHTGRRQLDMNFEPADGPLYVARWLRADGRNMKHRYFRRRHDAQAFADKLANGGWQVRVYLTSTTWKPHTEGNTP